MRGSRVPQIVFWLPQGWCFWLACGKIGSSEDKNSLQVGFFHDRVALTGGFFGGGAAQKVIALALVYACLAYARLACSIDCLLAATGVAFLARLR